MKHGFKPRELTLLGLLTALLLVMALTPLGYLNVGPLAITFNMIPMAIAAIALGPLGGLVTGTVFGLTSFLQCLGIGGFSPMGAALFEIDPFMTVVLCFLPRVLTGVGISLMHKAVKKWAGFTAASFATGFLAAFLNTALFMLALVLLFGRSQYLQDLMGGMNPLLWICVFVGVNAIFEIAASTLLTGVVAKALERARLIGQ